MTFDERINKFKDYPRKTDCVIKARAKIISDKFASMESEFREFMSVFMTVLDMDRHNKLLSIFYTEPLISIGKLHSDYLILLSDDYAINADGKLCTIVDDGLVLCDYEDIVAKLMLDVDSNEISVMFDNLDNFIEGKKSVFSKIDAHLLDMDSDYKTFCKNTSKDLAEMFSIENVVKYSGKSESEYEPEESYDENNVPDVIKMRISINRIPDMQKKKIKSYYEVLFNNVINVHNKTVNLSFTVDVNKCSKISDSEVDILLDRDSRYTVYMTDEKGSSKKSFTGWELYKLNREFVASR